MICKYCGHNIPENDRFCSSCGAEVKADSASDTTAGNNAAYGNYTHNQGAYYGNQQNNDRYYEGSFSGNNPQQGYWAPSVNDKAPSIKEYLKWMLLYPLWNFIPGIGFVIYVVFCIKYALDNTYTARANYFKAVLIAQVVGVVFAVLMFIVMFTLFGATAAAHFSVLEEMDPSFFMYEFSETIPALFIK